MELLKYSSYTLIALSLSLLLGFISRAVLTIAAIHLIAMAAIVVAFTVGAISASTQAAYYHRQAVLLGFAGRAIAVVFAYWVVIGVGMWLFIGEDL